MTSVVKMDLRWKHPFSAVVGGPSSSGKSVFVTKFLENLPTMCDAEFQEVYWYYGKYRPNHISTPVQFREGLPELEDFHDTSSRKLIVVDDLMQETDKRIVDLFTRGCHHGNISIFYITQNIFHQAKGQRDISLNAHYMVCFKNPRDKAQIRHLAHQVCPENPLFLQDAYRDATSRAYGYLLLDMKQDTPEEYRYRTCIFPCDSTKYAYIPRK